MERNEEEVVRERMERNEGEEGGREAVRRRMACLLKNI